MMGGGLTYILFKNEQLTLRREMDQVRDRIKGHEVSINLHESDIAERLSYYGLRETLKSLESPLVEIELVEVYQEGEIGRDEPAIANR